MKSIRWLTVIAVVLSSGRGLPAQQKSLATSTLSQEQVGELVQEIADSQAQFLTDSGKGLSYKARWIDHQDDYTREVIGSTDGRVDRVLSEKGRPITPTRDTEERSRLERLSNPEKLRNENKSTTRLLPYFLALVRAMPQAMLYKPADSQPQLTDIDSQQFVLDYSPNPAFRPKSVAESTLGKLRGRLWIDAVDHHLLRIDIQIEQDVNVAGGVLVTVYHGGTVEYNQRRIAGGQYSWTHLRLHLHVRELMVKTTSIDAELTASDIRLLSPIPDGPEAIHTLLAMPIGSR